MSRTTRTTFIGAGAVLAALVLSIPDLQHCDTRAMNEVTTIRTAEMEYYDMFGHYAASLQELGPGKNGLGGLIGRDLASGEKGGYKFSLTLTPTGYTISAISGSRTFQVHTDSEAAPMSDPPEIRSPGVPTPQPRVPESSERYSYPAQAHHRTQSQSS
jgi:hypothetical protein